MIKTDLCSLEAREKAETQMRRAIEYAMSLAIEVLADLDKARAMLNTLRPFQGGEMIIAPRNCLPLDAAIQRIHEYKRQIEPSEAEE